MATPTHLASGDNKNAPPPPYPVTNAGPLPSIIGPVQPAQLQNPQMISQTPPTVVYTAQPPGVYPTQSPGVYPAQSPGVYPAQGPISPSHNQTAVVQQVVYTTPPQESLFSQSYKAIPIMPMWCAVLLLIVNIILPGLGTAVAGLTVFCCAQIPYNTSAGDICCLNILFGFYQFALLLAFIPLGWGCAVVWGVFFITISAKKYGKPDSTPSTTTQAPVAQQQVPTNL